MKRSRRKCKSCGRVFYCGRNDECIGLENYNDCTCYKCDKKYSRQCVDAYLKEGINEECYKYQKEAIVDKILYEL